jgi:hypothetical protein
MIDYTGVGTQLATVLAGVEGVNRAEYEVNEIDIRFSEMPILDVRLSDTDNEVRAGQDYVTELTLQCDLYAFDLSSIREAVTLRDSILKASQDAVRANPRFHGDLESSVIGPVEFTTSKDEGTGEFVAVASFQVVAIVFTDRS